MNNRQSDKTTAARKGVAYALALMLLLTAGLAPALAETATGALTIDDAKAIALTHARLTEADVFITKLKTDSDDGRKEFEVEFIAGETEYEYEVDATNGTLLKTSTETVSNKKKAIDPSQYIGFDKAVEIALADAGFAADAVMLVEVQFDLDDGRAEYEVAFIANGQEYQYDLDAVTGEVYEREVEKR